MEREKGLKTWGDQQLLEFLYQSKAILQGHFLLSSGYHSSFYLQCALLMSCPQEAHYAAEKVANLIQETYGKVDCIVSPALGGMLIGYQVACLLGVKNYFLERKNKKMVLSRGFVIERGQTAVIVEDVITTGKSAFEVKSYLEQIGVTVKGVSSIIQRVGNNQYDKKIIAPLKIEVPCYSSEECQLCQQGEEITQLGSRVF